MDDKERHDKGMAKRRKVLGNEWVDRSITKKTPFNSEFQDFITRYAWGELWQRPHFDERTRRILVIGSMIALGQWDEVEMHVRATANTGATPSDVREAMLHVAVYAGVPAANHALKIVKETYREMGVEP